MAIGNDVVLTRTIPPDNHHLPVCLGAAPRAAVAKKLWALSRDATAWLSRWPSCLPANLFAWLPVFCRCPTTTASLPLPACQAASPCAGWLRAECNACDAASREGTDCN